MSGPRKGCFKCGKQGHIAENCTSEVRLCFNCQESGHESAACPNPRTVESKSCYSCGGVGHISAQCPSLKVGSFGAGLGGVAGGPKCFTCGRFGHVARACPGVGFRGGAPFRSRAPPGQTVVCYKCSGQNHYARDCMATDPTAAAIAAKNASKTCYKCQQVGHIAAECPSDAATVA
jgi:cellular nucleic acid-binding protein